MLGLLRNANRTWLSQCVCIETVMKNLNRKNHMTNFQATYSDLINELYNHRIFTFCPYILDRYKKNLELHLDKPWENLRPIFFLSAFEKLSAETNTDPTTDEEKKKLYILAWSVELYQSSVLSHDDLSDNGLIREGKQTWFDKYERKMVCIYDTQLLYTTAHFLLDTYFKEDKNIFHINNIFDDSMYRFSWSQILDLVLPKDLKGKMTEEYNNLARERIGSNKSKMFVSLPIKLAVLQTGLYNEDINEQIDDICFKMGLLWTAWDDYVDCYPDKNLKERTFNDIEEGKCSWLIVNALKHATDSQRQILTANYGIRDSKNASVVKDIYKELDMTTKFKSYKNEMISAINEDLKKLSNPTVKIVFDDMLLKTEKWAV
ncbi:hypothetical protein PGB90_005136 [Kerria lacca]